MTSTNVFLAEIKADPDADAPRLIFADWLEERGDPLGEFIRLQCLQPRLLSRPQRCAVATRCDDLQRRFGHRWIGFNVPRSFHLRFRRGFPEQARLSGAVLVGPNGHRVLGIEMLRELRIDRWNRTGQAVIQVLGRSGCRARLDRLRISNCGLSIWEIRKLVRLPLARRIRHLDLSANQGICAASIREIANSEMMQRLETLDLRGAAAFRETREAILVEPAFDRLRSLLLSRHGVLDANDDQAFRQRFGERVEFKA